MHVEAFVLLKPRLHFWMFVHGVVVDDWCKWVFAGGRSMA